MSLFRSTFGRIILSVWLVGALGTSADAFQLEGDQVTIVYQDPALLKKLNYDIYLGQLRYYLRRQTRTGTDELLEKISIVTRQVQSVLDMHPENFHYQLEILPDVAAVRAKYQSLYDKQVDYIAFYAPGKNCIYLSPQKANIGILAHEIGHAVVENYFEVSPPVRVHEILAQFSERHLGN